MSAPKVAICVPYYRSVEGPTAMCFMGLGFRSAAHIAAVPISANGCYIEDNRNGAVQHALATGIDFDWLMWIDGDMIFPHDALLRLIEHDKDIVGANYRQRHPPHGFAGQYLDGSDNHLMEPGLHRMRWMPTGLLLTRFDIYRKLSYPWFKPGLNNEPRDDVYFCGLAANAGYEIWCDHDLTFQIGHISDQTIPWFQPEQLRPVVRGASINNERSAEEGRERARGARGIFEAATKVA